MCVNTLVSVTKSNDASGEGEAERVGAQHAARVVHAVAQVHVLKPDVGPRCVVMFAAAQSTSGAHHVEPVVAATVVQEYAST